MSLVPQLDLLVVLEILAWLAHKCPLRTYVSITTNTFRFMTSPAYTASYPVPHCHVVTMKVGTGVTQP